MLRDIPKQPSPHGQFIRETGENRTTQRHTPAPRPRTTQAAYTSTRARRHDIQSIELRSRCSDVHTDPKTAHTSKNRNRRPQRTSPTTRPRTNRAINFVTQVTRTNTLHRKQTPEPPLWLPCQPQGHAPAVSSSLPSKQPEATSQSQKKSGATAPASTSTLRLRSHMTNGGGTRPTSHYQQD
jgi:hypothetical protein